MRQVMAGAFFSLMLAVPALADELKFTPPPEGVPDTSSWATGKLEGPLTHHNVLASLAGGDDVIANMLVKARICKATENVCQFVVKYQMLDSDRTNRESTIAFRYVFLAPDGTRLEGYALSPSRHPLIYHLWTRRSDGWDKWLPGPDYDEQLKFSLVLTAFITEADRRGAFPSR